MKALLLLLLFPLGLAAQTDYDMDEVARNAPARACRSVASLADYFMKNTPDERGRIRAIFAWITLHVKYRDTNNKSEIWATPEHLDRQRPERVLENRTAVCQGYANLFQALARACGIECQIITGIVKNQEGEVMRTGHAWNAARIMGHWRLFDTTWSLPEPEQPWTVNDIYFLAPPNRFILNHLPDDPVWQMLPNPIDEDRFRHESAAEIHRYLMSQTEPDFNFQDTLSAWMALDTLQRIFSSERRMLQYNSHNQRIIFALGQQYWSLFFDLRAHLDSLSDHSILDESTPIDTAYYSANLDLLRRYFLRAKFHFNNLTEPARVAQAEKFYNDQDVACILTKMRGDMWTALFENRHQESGQSDNERDISALAQTGEQAIAIYREAEQTLDCRKLAPTCYELWHNISLIELQMAERHALFAQQLLNQKNIEKNRQAVTTALARAKAGFDDADRDTRELLKIPPVYAFVRERLRRVQQGYQTLKALELRERQQSLTGAIETALKTSPGVDPHAQSVAVQQEPILNDLNDLSNFIEDHQEDLGDDYSQETLFNLQLDAYAMKFNQSNLYLKEALYLQYRAQNPELKSQTDNLIRKAEHYLKAARQSLDALKDARRLSAGSIAQRQNQVERLAKSIEDFQRALRQ